MQIDEATMHNNDRLLLEILKLLPPDVTLSCTIVYIKHTPKNVVPYLKIKTTDDPSLNLAYLKKIGMKIEEEREVFKDIKYVTVKEEYPYKGCFSINCEIGEVCQK